MAAPLHKGAMVEDGEITPPVARNYRQEGGGGGLDSRGFRETYRNGHGRKRPLSHGNDRYNKERHRYSRDNRSRDSGYSRYGRTGSEFQRTMSPSYRDENRSHSSHHRNNEHSARQYYHESNDWQRNKHYSHSRSGDERYRRSHSRSNSSRRFTEEDSSTPPREERTSFGESSFKSPPWDACSPSTPLSRSQHRDNGRYSTHGRSSSRSGLMTPKGNEPQGDSRFRADHRSVERESDERRGAQNMERLVAEGPRLPVLEHGSPIGARWVPRASTKGLTGSQDAFKFQESFSDSPERRRYPEPTSESRKDSAEKRLSKNHRQEKDLALQLHSKKAQQQDRQTKSLSQDRSQRPYQQEKLSRKRKADEIVVGAIPRDTVSAHQNNDSQRAIVEPEKIKLSSPNTKQKKLRAFQQLNKFKEMMGSTKREMEELDEQIEGDRKEPPLGSEDKSVKVSFAKELPTPELTETSLSDESKFGSLNRNTTTGVVGQSPLSTFCSTAENAPVEIEKTIVIEKVPALNNEKSGQLTSDDSSTSSSDSSDTETDEEEVMRWAQKMFGIIPPTTLPLPPQLEVEEDSSDESESEDETESIHPPEVQVGAFRTKPFTKAKKPKKPRPSVPTAKRKRDEAALMKAAAVAKKRREEARTPTTAELKAILGDDFAAPSGSSNFVRRSVRQPCKSVLNSSKLKGLLDKLRGNDSDMVVLKMKKYVNDPDAPQVVIDAALDALEENTNCQALYIQNFNKAMHDKQVLRLLRILQMPSCKIWCLNIGETYNVKMKTWKIFAKGLKRTKVTHMYASEHTITPKLKEIMRDNIRMNRQKHDMHINPDNLDVIVQCTHCWWNPLRAKALRPYLQKGGYDHILNDREAQGLKGTSSAINL